MPEDAPLYVCQKAIIEKDGKVLIMNDPFWGSDLPGGKIQVGELKDRDVMSIELALKREVLEETGLQIGEVSPFFVSYYEYPVGHRNHGKQVYLVIFTAKYLSGEVVLSEEHDGYKWVGIGDYKSMDDGSGFFSILEKYFQK